MWICVRSANHYCSVIMIGAGKYCWRASKMRNWILYQSRWRRTPVSRTSPISRYIFPCTRITRVARPTYRGSRSRRRPAHVSDMLHGMTMTSVSDSRCRRSCYRAYIITNNERLALCLDTHGLFLAKCTYNGTHCRRAWKKDFFSCFIESCTAKITPVMRYDVLRSEFTRRRPFIVTPFYPHAEWIASHTDVRRRP